MFRPHWVCPAHGCLCFPVYTAQAPGCSIWSRPCVECGSSFPVLHKSADSVAPAFCAFPGLSGSGSQRLGRPLPGCGAPFPLHSPSLSFCARWWLVFVLRSWPLATTLPGWVSTIQNLRKALAGNWRPVCSVGGDAFSGAEFAPCPSPLPPTSGRDGPVRRRLALLWSFSVPLFCERPVVRSSWLIFSLAIPQFKRAPFNCSQGRSLLQAMPPAPLHSAPTCWWQMRASGVLFCWELLLGT